MKMKNLGSGVYELSFRLPDGSLASGSKVYIGSSVSISSRYFAHLDMLDAGRHTNSRFQNWYDLATDFERDCISIRVLESVDRNGDLAGVEQRWIDRYDFDDLFNGHKRAWRAVDSDDSPPTSCKPEIEAIGDDWLGRSALLRLEKIQKRTDETKIELLGRLVHMEYEAMFHTRRGVYTDKERRDFVDALIAAKK